MREHSRDRGRLEDMLKYAQNVEQIVSGITYDQFVADLWQTATSDILPLREQVQCYLADIDWEQWAQGEDSYTEIDNAAYKQAVESARRMKAKGFAVADIAEITSLTAEEIEGL